MRRVELGVYDVHELPGANGFVITATGFIPAPTDAWGENLPPADGEFFPGAAGMSVKLELEWHHFAGPKPKVAEFGSTIFVDLEPGYVPTEPVNRGPQAPRR
jgi:hypothetical protein